MAIRKNTKVQPQTISSEGVAGSDLSLRLEKISEQTGLSIQSLMQKWILQEEAIIGIMRHGKGLIADKAPVSTGTAPQDSAAIQESKAEAVPPDTNSPKYWKTLVKRTQKLKKEGITLKKIAEILNDEKISTVSGTGKWYASSVTNLLNSKK